LASARRDSILRLLQARGSVRVSELAETLDVAEMTVRRDLVAMDKAGLLRRTHGGAEALDADAGAVVQPSNGKAIHPAARTKRIGMLVPDMNFYWPEVARGAEQAANDAGYLLALRVGSYETVDERPTLAPLYDDPDVVGVLAVIRTDSPNYAQVAEWLQNQDKPTVLVERDARHGQYAEPFESVVSDHEYGAGLGIHYLAELGHKRVGGAVCAGSPHREKIRAGWREAAKSHDLEIGVDVLIPSNTSPEFPGELKKLVKRIKQTGTTGILAHSDPEAMALVQALQEAGLSVPEDVSVLSYDDGIAELFTPALTAIHPPRSSLGLTSVEMLLSRIADPGLPVRKASLIPSLVVRGSTAGPRS
jgi:DNA-binding LacI/PurR family transcriptional regulator